MGSPKQILRVGGERMVDRAIHACRASGLAPILIVLGAHAEVIQSECDLDGVEVVFNHRWAEGMATSLRAGIAAAASHGVDAAVVMTADMPFVSGDHLRALAEKSQETGSNVASWYEGWRGIPACFTRASFGAIGELQGDTGGRALLLHAPVVEGVLGFDVDTPDELQGANAMAPKVEG